jgi:hypothetical protein
MKKITLFACLGLLMSLWACNKDNQEVVAETDEQMIDFQKPDVVLANTGKNYDADRSNLYGIPQSLLAAMTSDELFGLQPASPWTPEDMQTVSVASEETATETPEVGSYKVEDVQANPTYYNSYSWLNTNPAHSTMVYNWDVFIYVENDGGMTAPADNDKVVFYALQTDFGGGQGAHTGLQWANGVKKVNWGGYWSGVVQPAHNFCGTHSCNFSWSPNTPYRFRVWRLGINTSTNRTQWGAWVMNMWTNQETFIGSFYSTANRRWITGQSTWIETIKTGTSPLSNRNIQAVFSYMVYRTAAAVGPINGAFQPYHAYAGYNDTETPPPSPYQNKNVSYTFDNIWWGVQTKTIRHKFNTIRTVPNGAQLW